MADVLVVGLSARALAQSARAAGFRPLAADVFCDLDLRASADRAEPIDGDYATGLAGGPMLAALAAAAAGRRPIGIVCGAGFEDRPHLLDELARRWTLFGNGADAVRRVKDPAALSALCAHLAIPHPRWSETAREGWLAKQEGGSGGTHIGGARSLPPCGGGPGRGDR